MTDDIISMLENLQIEVDAIVNSLRSKHDGSYSSYPGGQDIPHLVLNKTEIEFIYNKLHAQGSAIQTILNKVRKKYGDEIVGYAQKLVDFHSHALRIAGSLKLGQIHMSEAGMLLEPVLSFHGSILTTINGISTLNSYDSTGKGWKKLQKKESGSSFSLSRKSKKIIIAIILGILGIGTASYEIHVSNIQIIGSNGINFGNQQTTIVNNPTISTTSPPRQLNEQDISLINKFLPQNKSSIVHIKYLVNDQESYQFANQIDTIFKNNGWNTTFNAAMYDPPFTGIHFKPQSDGELEIEVGSNK